MSTTTKTPDALSVFPSALGWMALVSRGGAIVALSFGHRGRKAAIEAARATAGSSSSAGSTVGQANRGTRHFASLVRRLQAYARGRSDDFRDLRIDLGRCTAFRRRVLACCRQVGYGRTVSYGQLAAKAGVPRAARAVGNCMAANPLPLIVPCHRVIAADGRPGAYSAPGGTRMKRRLLAMERARQSGVET
ncbi:MAG: methylated-DNA--[protein]-cysteine S-methyltransferase [Thermoguttaceae bacterium]